MPLHVPFRGFSVSALLCALLGTLLTALLTNPCLAADPVGKKFDIPGGEAFATLRQFCIQAETRLLYSADAVRGVKTNVVKGTYTPQEALTRMVADTGLVVTVSAGDGTLAVSRKRSALSLPCPSLRLGERLASEHPSRVVTRHQIL